MPIEIYTPNARLGANRAETMASLTKYLSFFLLFLLAGPVAATVSGKVRLGGDWRTQPTTTFPLTKDEER